MGTEQPVSNKSAENKVFYILIFSLSLLAILFGTFWGKKNSGEEAKKCLNETVNYPQCDKCQEGKNLVGAQCIDNINENVQNEPTDFEKYETYKKVSIYPEGLITPTDYVRDSKVYLNDDG